MNNTLKTLMKNGQKILETASKPPCKSARRIVRIYYMSEGNELLCVDTDPLTWQAARKLKTALTHNDSVAVRVESYDVRNPPKLSCDARLVKMPSQIST